MVRDELKLLFLRSNLFGEFCSLQKTHLQKRFTAAIIGVVLRRAAFAVKKLAPTIC